MLLKWVGLQSDRGRASVGANAASIGSGLRIAPEPRLAAVPGYAR
jgi:hypothetical protein